MLQQQSHSAMRAQSKTVLHISCAGEVVYIVFQQINWVKPTILPTPFVT